MSSPRPPRPLWVRLARPGVKAAAEALFPPNDLGAPDWRDTDLVERSLDYFAELPPHQGRLISLLYIVIHILPWVFLSSPLPFGWVSQERRTRIVQSWRTSRLYLARMLGDSLKATMTIVYLQHPAPLRFIGVFSICANEGDPYDLDIRPNALAESAAGNTAAESSR